MATCPGRRTEDPLRHAASREVQDDSPSGREKLIAASSRPTPIRDIGRATTIPIAPDLPYNYAAANDPDNQKRRGPNAQKFNNRTRVAFARHERIGGGSGSTPARAHGSCSGGQ